MQADAIHERLIEWGRWVRLRPQQGHCASIEHRYRRVIKEGDTRTGWGDYFTEPPLQLMTPIDEFRALEVEKIMRHLPAKHRLALALHYVDRTPFKRACKRLAIGYLTWDDLLGDAQRMVGNLLTRHKTPRNIAANSVPPAKAEITALWAGAARTPEAA
jgi:hypothetical protein